MLKNINQKLEMFRRVLVFGQTARTELAQETYAVELLQRLAEVVDRLWEYNGRKADARIETRAVYGARAAARTALRGQLRTIQRTAQGMAANVPEAAGKFILPTPLTDKALMETARVFLERATPLAAEFTRRAMPANFLTELRARRRARHCVASCGRSSGPRRAWPPMCPRRPANSSCPRR
ncbi:MAG: hypothetical protein ACKV2V_22410 [Blastocatellia bacterium]